MSAGADMKFVSICIFSSANHVRRRRKIRSAAFQGLARQEGDVTWGDVTRGGTSSLGLSRIMALRCSLQGEMRCSSDECRMGRRIEIP